MSWGLDLTTSSAVPGPDINPPRGQDFRPSALGEIWDALVNEGPVGAAATAQYFIDRATGGELQPLVDSAAAKVDEVTRPLQELGNAQLGAASWIFHHLTLVAVVVAGVGVVLFLGPELAALRAAGKRA